MRWGAANRGTVVRHVYLEQPSVAAMEFVALAVLVLIALMIGIVVWSM